MRAATFRLRHLALLAGATSLGALMATGAFAGDFTVTSGTTNTTKQTLSTGGNVGTVESGGTLQVSNSSEAVTISAPNGTVALNNAGTIAQTGSSRAVRFNVGASTATVLLSNAASGVISSVADDVMKFTFAGTYTIDNQGTIWAKGAGVGTGQALDLRDVASSVGNTIVNGSLANTAATIRADGDDALRPGANTVITNYGTIISNGPVNTKCPDYIPSCTSGKSAHDAIDVGGNTGVVLNNYGSVSGPRHAITADNSITVNNYASGVITGRNGSGVGSDGTGTVYNRGLISGDHVGAGNAYNQLGLGLTTSNGDGDGVDIDLVAYVENWGTIRGTGAGGVDSGGLPNGSEGIAAGGGTIINHAGATISGAASGIMIDNGAGGAGVAAVTITNQGVISGTTAYGIYIAGGFDNTITNSGTISGGNGSAIVFGSGTDQLNIRSGSVINGTVDGGAGTDAIDLSGSGTTAAPDVFAGAANFETLAVSTGVWRLTGASQGYANGITVASGATLDAAGTIGSRVTVASGATLVGTGSIGDLALSGTLAPGSLTGSRATLSVNGTVSFLAGSTLRIDAAPDGSADKVAATGAVTIGGGTVAVSAGAGVWSPSTKFVIVTGSSVSGTFASVATDLAFLTPQLGYTATEVDLTLVRNATLMQSVAATTNQSGVAAAIDRAPTSSALYLTLVGTSAAGARAAYDSLSGEGNTAVTGTAFGTGSAFAGGLGRASGQWASGTAGQGLAVVIGGSSPVLAYGETGGGAHPAAKPRIEVGAVADQAWRLWASGFGGTGTTFADVTNGATSVTSRGFGGALGIDTRIAGELVLGLALGGSQSRYSVDDRAAHGTIDGFHIAPYARLDSGAWSTSASLSWSNFDNRTRRTISGGGASEEVTSGFGAQEWRAHLELGRTFALGSGRLTPFVALEAANLSHGDHTEKKVDGSASSLGLTMRAGDTWSVPLFIGAGASHRFDLGDGRALTPALRAAWVHEFTPARDETATFSAVSTSDFVVHGARAAADSLHLNADLTGEISRSVSLFAGFEGEFSDRGRTLIGKGGFKVAW